MTIQVLGGLAITIMRILHVISRLAECDGGPPQGLVILAKAQSEQGDEIIILPCSSYGGKMLLEPGTYGRLTVMKPPTNSKLIWPESKVKQCLLSFAKNIDIIHIHGSWRCHLVAAGTIARKFNIPFIISPEGNLGSFPRRHKWYLKKVYFHLMEKKLFESANAIHCYTRKELNEVRELKLSPPHFIVPQPVENSLLQTTIEAEHIKKICPSLKNDDQVVLYLGRMAWIKRLPLLIEAFVNISNEFKHSHLILAGPWKDQHLVDDMRKRIAQAKLESRVHLPGMVRGKDKVAILQRADIFVLPSFHENFGISAAEALLFGKPCIVSDGVALADEISVSGAGLVFSGEVDELAGALRQLLANDILRRTCGEKAKNLASNFDPRFVAAQFRIEYEKCIRDKELFCTKKTV